MVIVSVHSTIYGSFSVLEFFNYKKVGAYLMNYIKLLEGRNNFSIYKVKN
jgi:hypothetical protein